MFKEESEFLANGVEKDMLLLSPFLVIQVTITRVINTEVKNEQAIPIINTIAKPFTGPWPKANKIAPVKKVVTLPSKIAENAFSYPMLIADSKLTPLRSSSLIRSKINTFASIDIPMVNTIPAIPGRVKAVLS